MGLAFLFFLGSLLVPAFLVTFRKPAESRPFLGFPTALAFQIFFSGLFAAFLSRWLGFGIPLYLSVVCLATIANSICLRKLACPKALIAGRYLKWRPLLFIGCLAFVATADLGVIFGANGWGLEGGEAYFRPPLHNDNYRNLVLIETLERRGQSPFLPASALLYQTFWHSLAGTFLFPFQGPSRYSFVAGATWATALLFFFFLFWAFSIYRPRLFMKGNALILFLLVMVAAHADLYHFLGSYFFTGRPGIEADWSVNHRFFRMFSLKMLAMTSPQHALFFGALAIYLAWRKLAPRRRNTLTFQETLLISPCYLVSPLLSLFLFPLMFAWEGWKKKKRASYFLSRVILFVAVNALYWAVIGASPLELFVGRTGDGLSFFPWLPEALAQIPLSLFASAGMLGFIASVLMVRRFQRFGKEGWNLESAILLGGGVIFLFILDDQEVRRHYAMLAAFTSAFFLVKAFPLRSPEPWIKWGTLGVASVTLFLHGYFLYSYLLKPSKLDPTIPWQDYFAMNERLSAKYSGIPVLAAVDPWNLGLEMPIAMEATTSFSLPEHATIHSKLTARHRDLMKWIHNLGSVLPAAQALGYHLMLWGPVEERVWGRQGRERFRSQEPPLETVGSVKLYRLEDHLLASLRSRNQGPEVAARRLEEEGWQWEALEAYQDILRAHPNHLEAGLAASRLFLENFNPKQSLEIAEHLLQRHPKASQAWLLKGKALRKMTRFQDALAALRSGNQLNPSDVGIYEEAVDLLLEGKEWAHADHLLREGLKVGKGKPQEASLFLLSARLSQAQGNIKGALLSLQRAQNVASAPQMRREVALRLGDFYYQGKSLEAAKAQYHLVLAQNPDDIAALLRMGILHLDEGKRREAVGTFRAVLRRDKKNLEAQNALEHLGEVSQW